MRKGISLLILLFLMCNYVLAQSNDVEGWSKARWGMTEDDLLKAFEGQAIRLEQKNYNDSYSTIEIRDIEIGSDHYQVRFLMDNNKKTLSKVLITPLDTDLAAAEIRFKGLEKLLIEKYGQPSFRDDKKEPDTRISGSLVHKGSVKLTTAWNFSSTIIELSYLELRSINMRSLVISYSQRVKLNNL